MPKLTLAVCVYRQRDLLARLLSHSEGCYDDLVVIHDGPDDSDVRSLVEAHGGRFLVEPRRFQQEPHWPRAWREARHDWILRWDADEFPSEELADWLRNFRQQPEPDDSVSAYSCILPLWNGQQARTSRWPRRISILDRRKVRYFGMADQSPIPDGKVIELDLVLRHQPPAAAYGVSYTVRNPKVRIWHDEIARSLLGKPTDLPCWRWDDPAWPRKWEAIRRRPLLTALKRLFLSPYWNLREMLAYGERPRLSYLTFFPLQHWMTCMSYIRLRKERARQAAPDGEP